MATKTFKIGLSDADKLAMSQAIYEQVEALLFDEYDSSKTYDIGDYTVYSSVLYRCIVNNTTGTWNSANWEQATLQDLVDYVNGAVETINDKANVDGNYPTMTVGVADQLSPYDEKSGDDQDEPFSFQATGTGNGSQPDFATGAIALLKEKQGNSVVVNQWRNTYYARTVQGITIADNNNGTVTITGTAEASDKYSFVSLSNLALNHVYLIYSTYRNALNYSTANSNADFTTATKVTLTTSGNLYVNFPTTATTQYNETFSVYVIDLTQWFNGDIPQDLLDNPSNFFRYYQGSLAFNTGTIVDSNGRYIKCIGMNQFDGTNDVNAIPNATYYINGGATLTYKDREGNTISSESKSNQTFVAPSNCLYIGVSGSGDISINIYYEKSGGVPEPRCLTYEPYEVLTNTDTGTETLRSVGSVKDYKEPDGTLIRRVGVVDLGTLNWNYNSSYGMYSSGISSLIKRPANDTTKANVLCSIRKTAPYAGSGGVYSSGTSANLVGITSGGSIAISTTETNTTNFKNAMSGVPLYYELATPTTEQGTSFSPNLVIDDFGSMSFEGTNGVPQGNLIFYPVDYKAFIDTLYNYTEGTPSNLALNSELSTKFETYLKSLTGYDGTKTQSLKNVEGTLTWVDDE